MDSDSSLTSNYEKKKRIQDPIHGLMEFDNWIVKYIDTSPVQRLRNIKQLGSVYYVYPGASHNRFEHCLGVAHLANSLVKRIQTQQPELEKNENDLKCVTLAALCHDLGHGPFSHTFEKDFIRKKRPDSKWGHEEGSKMMLKLLIDEVNGSDDSDDTDDTDDFDSDDVKFIKNLITGESNGTSRPKYLFDVVANERNSVDVDKFDYIPRDCYYLGIKSAFDSSRLMKFSRVIDDEITYYFKESYNIYELFHTRYSLHKRAYVHRVSRAIDYMICDVLVEADDVFKISESIDYEYEYLRMDDTILNRIEFSGDSSLKKAKEIIKRIQTRKLYKFVDEILIPDDLNDRLNVKKIDEEIVALRKRDDEFDLGDVIVDRSKLNYGNKINDPVGIVKFYDKNNPNKAFNLDGSQVSHLVPGKFQEYCIRIFTRNRDKVGPIRRCFIELMKKFTDQKTYYSHQLDHLDN